MKARTERTATARAIDWRAIEHRQRVERARYARLVKDARAVAALTFEHFPAQRRAAELKTATMPARRRNAALRHFNAFISAVDKGITERTRALFALRDGDTARAIDHLNRAGDLFSVAATNRTSAPNMWRGLCGDMRRARNFVLRGKVQEATALL